MASNESTLVASDGGAVPVTNQNTPDNVTALAPEQAAWLKDSILPRTLLKGTMGMRDAGNEFLPQHPLESNPAYRGRLLRSTLLNAYRKTCSFLAGQVFQADITFADEVPEEFITYSDSVDIKGNALDVFAKRSFFDGLGKGVSAIMVDAPKISTEDVKTVADEKAIGFRAYFKDVKPEDILGGLVDENGTLIQLRILETTTQRVGRYGSKTVSQVRVLEPGTWEVHTINDDGSTVMLDFGTTLEGTIPVIFYIPGEEMTIITGETPLRDLADLNAKHWRSSSDQDNILHIARVPILFTRHVDTNILPVGTATMIGSTEDNSDMKYVEHSGAAIDAGANDLEQTESQMALYGLQQLVPRTGNMTATEKAINSAESNSSLGTWVIEFESCLQAAFELFGKFIGVEFPANGVTVNREFLLGLADPQELAQILASYDSGIISAQAAFTEFRRRGVFDEHLIWDDMEADKEQEKRDAIEMAQLAGSTFGDDGNTGDDEDDTGDSNKGDGE